MTTYTWSIKKIKVATNYQGHQNVVKNVQWFLTADNDGSQKTIMGSCLLEDPTDTFIDYDSLTESVVISWVEQTLGLEKISRMKEGLENALLSGDNSSTEELPLPWA